MAFLGNLLSALKSISTDEADSTKATEASAAAHPFPLVIQEKLGATAHPFPPGTLHWTYFKGGDYSLHNWSCAPHSVPSSQHQSNIFRITPDQVTLPLNILQVSPLAYQRNILSKTHAALPIWPCPAFIILPNFSPQFCNMAVLTTQTCCVHMAETSHPLLPLLGETCPSNIRMMTYLSGLRSGKPSPRKLYLIHPFIVQTDCPLSIFPPCTTVTHIMAIYHIVL